MYPITECILWGIPYVENSGMYLSTEAYSLPSTPNSRIVTCIQLLELIHSDSGVNIYLKLILEINLSVGN